MPDMSHLVALSESLSRSRLRLENAQNEHQRQFFQSCIDAKQHEIDAELSFLGMPTADEFLNISGGELLRELTQ